MRAPRSWDNNSHHSHSWCEGPHPEGKLSGFMHPGWKLALGIKGKEPKKHKCQNFPTKCHVSCVPLPPYSLMGLQDPAQVIKGNGMTSLWKQGWRELEH